MTIVRNAIYRLPLRCPQGSSPISIRSLANADKTAHSGGSNRATRGNVQMRLNHCLMSALLLIAVAALTTRGATAAELQQVDLTEWTPPQMRSVGDDPFGKLVKYGHALMVDTANQIGPTAADPAKRYS